MILRKSEGTFLTFPDLHVMISDEFNFDSSDTFFGFFEPYFQNKEINADLQAQCRGTSGTSSLSTNSIFTNYSEGSELRNHHPQGETLVLGGRFLNLLTPCRVDTLVFYFPSGWILIFPPR